MLKLMALVALEEESLDLACWQSTRGKRAPWNGQRVLDVALSVVRSMPRSALEILKSEAWKKSNGAPVVSLQDSVGWSVTCFDVVKNRSLLRELLRASPSTVPSGYWIADVLLPADQVLKGRFLAPGGTGSDKFEQALREGQKGKKLIQYVRRLWRANACSRDTHINELKSLLQGEEVAVEDEDENEDACNSSDEELAPIRDGDPLDEEQFFREIDEVELDESRKDDDDTFWRELEKAFPKDLESVRPPALPEAWSPPGPPLKKTKKSPAVMKRPASTSHIRSARAARPPAVSMLDFADDASRNTYLSEIGVPMECMPTQAPLGKGSYTVRTSGGAAVQVLVAKRKFFLVSKHGGVLEPGEKQTYTWGEYPMHVWKEVRAIAGWDDDATAAQ